jgi:hypothetical protein
VPGEPGGIVPGEIERGRGMEQFESSRDHFTLTYTYTDADGATSRLSLCQERAAHPDGDGSPDPLDALMGTESDPTAAVIATANEQLLVVGDAAMLQIGLLPAALISARPVQQEEDHIRAHHWQQAPVATSLHIDARRSAPGSPVRELNPVNHPSSPLVDHPSRWVLRPA